MSELKDKQWLFMDCLRKLLSYANIRGYRLRVGEAYVGDSINKPGEDTPHLRTGAHFNRTGIDLVLDVWDPYTKEWVMQPKDCPQWQDLGKYWKTLSEQARWGGDFSSVDLNHFSIIYNGIS